MKRTIVIFAACWSLGSSNAEAVGMEFGVESDGVAQASTGFPGGLSEVSKRVHELRALIFPQIAPATHARLGVAWQRVTLDGSGPIPGKVQAASTVIGIDRRLSPKWDMRFEVKPGLYGDLSDIHGGTWNAPLICGLSYFASQKLLLLGGFMIDPRGTARFFPFFGLRWQMDKQWALELIAPRPRIHYQLNEHIGLYTGLELRGGSYRMARDFGTHAGDARLNEDILEMREFRVGGGMDWKITPKWFLDVSGGWLLERRFHYQRTNVDYYSEGAPYAQLSLRYKLPH